MIKYLNSKIFKRIFANAGILVSGSVISSLIGLISFALIARVLGTKLFGMLALVQAYAVIIDKLINFQSWQALIKYGTDSFEKKNYDEFKKLISFGFSLDFSTAILATIVGVTFPYLFGPLIGWQSDKIMMASVFSTIIIFNIEGTPTAILRIFNRYKPFAYKAMFTSLTKVILVMVGFFLKLNLWYFIIITMVSLVFGYLYLLIAGIKTLKKYTSDTNIFTIKYLFSMNENFSGIWSYIWTTNLHGSVRMVSSHLDIIIIDSILGSVATGLYQIVKQFSQIFNRISQPLYKAIYPELSKLWANNNKPEFKNVIKRFSLLGLIFGMSVWFVFLFFGKKIILITVGESYITSYSVLIWYFLGVVISVATFPVTPAFLAIGLPKVPFYTLIISTSIYLSSLYLSLKIWGINGAGYSYFIFFLSWIITLWLYYKKNIKLFT